MKSAESGNPSRLLNYTVMAGSILFGSLLALGFCGSISLNIFDEQLLSNLKATLSVLSLAVYAALGFLLYKLFFQNIFNPRQAENPVSSIEVNQLLADPPAFEGELEQVSTILKKLFQVLNPMAVEIEVISKEAGLSFFSFYKGQQSSDNVTQLKKFDFSVSDSLNGHIKISLDPAGSLSKDAESVAKIFAIQLSIALSSYYFLSNNFSFRQVAQEGIQAKISFLAQLSHEIRAPLGVVLNATELLLDGLCGEISEDQKRFLSLTKKSSDHLLELIGDVLDYAKIEAGKLVPQKKAVPVNEIIKDVLNISRLLAESKHIKVDSKETVQDLYASVDRKHFRQILINLATNAVKYTPDGGSIDIWAEPYGSNEVKIYVKDTGVGIAEGDRGKVFEPFERLNHEYAQKQSGVGIGLSLAKRLAEINAGDLNFRSEPGKGSVFCLELPKAVPGTDGMFEDLDTRESIEAHGERLVIIDSDSEHLDIVSTYLSDLAYPIQKFTSYKEAKALLERNECELLIVDNQIFDDSQHGFGEEIAGLAQKNNLPIILLSSRAFVFDLERYLKMGVERCLPKPAPLKELASLCRQIFSYRSS